MDDGLGLMELSLQLIQCTKYLCRKTLKILYIRLTNGPSGIFLLILTSQVLSQINRMEIALC